MSRRLWRRDKNHSRCPCKIRRGSTDTLMKIAPGEWPQPISMRDFLRKVSNKTKIHVFIQPNYKYLKFSSYEKFIIHFCGGGLFSMSLSALPLEQQVPPGPAQNQIEANNVGNHKFIFYGTPFVKYADSCGVITIPSNYYHHKYEKLRSFGYTLQSWTGSNGKTYLPDNNVSDAIVTRDTLTSDVILMPNFVLNEEDLGDATVTTLWEFGLPDSVALFRNFQNVCSFVKPTLYNSYYIDMNNEHENRCFGGVD